MKKFFKSFYFTQGFFWSLLVLCGLYVLTFISKIGILVPNLILLIFICVVLIDIALMYRLKKGITIERHYPEKLSNGDENEFILILVNLYPHKVKAKILEELPVQFQYRDFKHFLELTPQVPRTLSYTLRPTERGEYTFGACNVLLQYLGFIQRRFRLEQEYTIPCYPSFIQLRKYSLLATTNRLTEAGVKKIRRIGNTMEFERIRDYVPGDDYRFINWKATAKSKSVMINQYQEEKSQPIYSLLDLGRSMQMPFEGLSLLDYSINSSLVLSNISIIKQDRAGILTFSRKVNTHIPAEKHNKQMQIISESLYRIDTEYEEPEYGRLYTFVRRIINQRSLLFLYTNFETLDAMHRQLPYLKLLNKSHILVVIIFKNTELAEMARTRAESAREIYNQIIAEKLIYEKNLIIHKLRQNGLQTILTEPQNLTLNSINKYLEIKARGLI